MSAARATVMRRNEVPTAGQTLAPRAETACFGDVRAIGGIDVSAVTGTVAVEMLSQRLEARTFTRLAFLNAHCVNLAYERPDYRASLSGFLMLPDGVGIDIGARLLHGGSFPENLNGTDFVPALLAGIARPLRVALIGGEPGIPERAAEAFGRLSPQHAYIPVSHGFFDAGAETEAVLAQLRAVRADIVLVALGVPRQEIFIAGHLTSAEASLAIGVGALLDFVAGKVPRAPTLVRGMRLEWLYRLAIEPRRLWKRYILGNPRFLAHILNEKRKRARPEA